MLFYLFIYLFYFIFFPVKEIEKRKKKLSSLFIISRGAFFLLVSYASSPMGFEPLTSPDVGSRVEGMCLGMGWRVS